MKIVIPLAGKGTRLRPHTSTKPKPLLPVAGRPILAHILDSLEGIKFSEVIFITGYLKEKIESYVKENYKFNARFIEQKDMDGTAGAIKAARQFLDEDLLIMYADTIFDADFSLIGKMQRSKDIDGIMWVHEVEDYQRFGVIVCNPDGTIKRIVEKPKEPISKLANIGVYYVKNSAMLLDAVDYIYEKEIKLGAEYFLTDAFQYMISNGSRMKTADVKDWYDCGQFEGLLETNRLLLDRMHARPNRKAAVGQSTIIPPVWIDDDAIVERSIIGPHVSIGKGTVIRNSIIKNSILDKSALLENIRITDSVIGESAVVKGHFKKLSVGDYSEVNLY